jgi:P27 family predicted phage terminase small subunit
MPGGRPQKPLEDHELDGTYRADRHGEKVTHLRPDGAPERPTDFGEDAAWLWDQLIIDLGRKNVAYRIDTAALRGVCEWYGRYRKLSRALDKLDAEDERVHRMVASASECWRRFEAMAAQFGLTPVARMRLQIPKEDKPSAVGSRARKAG